LNSNDQQKQQHTSIKIQISTNTINIADLEC